MGLSVCERWFASSALVLVNPADAVTLCNILSPSAV
ncbi:protein of unknown function [Candidatus Methylocalor cossyra]|uniref:Uncharacterized protein n=1 Tax=Candidatus Methylocalor cossyra TaxID=3108543 RepID=A0ABM9NKR1_9GAMM